MFKRINAFGWGFIAALFLGAVVKSVKEKPEQWEELGTSLEELLGSIMGDDEETRNPVTGRPRR